MSASAAVAMSPAQGWSCPQCTLINDWDHPRCVACAKENPQPRPVTNGHTLPSWLRLPPLSSVISRVDDAIDYVADRLQGPIRSFSAGSPASRRSPTIVEVSAEWLCARCSQVNQPSEMHCVWCNFQRGADVTAFMSWHCSHCHLRQPTPPVNFKCPLCRTKTSRMLTRTAAASMPQLSLPPLARPKPVSSARASTAESDEIYNNILQFCKANNQTFVDDGFPHSSRSIGNAGDLERRDLDIVWLRPQQIVTRDGMKYPWSVFNDPQPTDIEQGHVGNCWAIAALAVIAERPDILDKIMLTKTYAQYGVYQIRLCIDGVWQTVVVDDFFPCHRRSHTMIFAVGRKNQLWVSLIEKGMAKMYGNYSLLRAGRSVEGLAAFTGAPCLYIDLEPDDHFEKSSASVKKAALDEIWAKLLSSREANFVMGTSCGAGRRALDEQEYTRVGLMSRHAYSILDVRQLDNHRLVRLRNPWGAYAWKGEWGVGWAGWTTALRKRLNTTDAPGTFWMPFEKYIHYFDSVDIAQIRNMHGWKAVRVPVEIGWDERKCGAVRMVLTEPTEVCVTLFQRNARTVLDQVDLMVAIHYEDPATHGPGELAVRSARRIQPNVRTDDVFLPAGGYIVTAFSFAKFDDKTVPGTIVIHSSRKVSAEVFMAGPNVLQQSLVSLVLKEGTAEELVSGCITRYVTNDFAGLLLMVDNVLSDHCLQVQSDCNRSLNVLSTRSTLVATDSVPPLHRQILTILSHFEPSSHYVVEHRLSQRFVKYGQLRDYAPQSPEAQNLPAFTSAAVFALHGPKPLYA